MRAPALSGVTAHACQPVIGRWQPKLNPEDGTNGRGCRGVKRLAEKCGLELRGADFAAVDRVQGVKHLARVR